MSSDSLENLWFPCNELAPLDPLEKSSSEAGDDDNDALLLLCGSVMDACDSFSTSCFPEQILQRPPHPQTAVETFASRGSNVLEDFAFHSSAMELPVALHSPDQHDNSLDDGKDQSRIMEKSVRQYEEVFGGTPSNNDCSEKDSLKSFAFENIEQMKLGDDLLAASMRDFGALCSQSVQSTDAGSVAPSLQCCSDAAGPIVSTTTRSDAIDDTMGAFSGRDSSDRERTRYTQKPPTTAGITLEDLKAVFHLHRPEAERRLNLKRTTFSNLSRHYGISKWPFRTLRDADNRISHNENLLRTGSLSRDRKTKIQAQQRRLHAVKALMYEEPCLSKDSNTLSALLQLVESRELKSEFR